jgi:hypothetical protein
MRLAVTAAGPLRTALTGVAPPVVDAAAGTCDVIVNCGELRHRFSIPSGRSVEYIVGATFANEHKLRRMMDVLRGKIRFPADVNNHGYFLREPDFLGWDATVAAKVLKQVKLTKHLLL